MQINIALLTITDSRTIETDKSGSILKKKIAEQNHKLVDRILVKDSKNKIVRNNNDLKIDGINSLLEYFFLGIHILIFETSFYFFLIQRHIHTQEGPLKTNFY